MADFTEEYLKRLTDVENQKVAQLSGIKDVLKGSGSGGGTGSRCLGVKISQAAHADDPTLFDLVANRTAREVVGALESGDGISVYQDVSMGKSWFMCLGLADWTVARDEQGRYGLTVTPFDETQRFKLVADSLDDYFVYYTTEPDDPSESDQE